jgi:transmembrane sensor
MKDRCSMNKTLLERYFLDELDATEKEQVVEWMKDPGNDAELKAWMQENWETIPERSGYPVPSMDGIWQNLQNSINNEETDQVEAPVVALFKKRKKQYMAIAAVFVLMLCSYGVYEYFNTSSSNNHLAVYGSNITTETNNTPATKKIMLEDGSEVLLSPSASVSFPTHFSEDKREVSLVGKAFFEVAKNPAKPFLVYSNAIVTKVLGTSFTIQTDSSTKNISVAVHTGRVQVLENIAANTDNVSTKALTSNGVIITANQRTVFSNSNHSFQTSLIASPLPVSEKKVENSFFDFNRQSIAVELDRIQQVYGVEVVLENENLGKCIFSGSLDEENLFEKLDIVCAAISASYEVSGTKVLLKGKGCK